MTPEDAARQEAAAIRLARGSVMSADEVRREILATLRWLGDASEGQIAAHLRLPTPRVEAVLSELLRRGEVEILPLSLTWTVS